MQIRNETAADVEAIRTVNAAAFGQPDEARLVDALRAGGYVCVSLVAVIDGDVVGHILLTELPITADHGQIPATALAPLAVLPAHQRQGVGSALVRAGLDACREAGYRACIVLGHPEYYPKFGFSAALGRQIGAPYSGDSFMAAELEPGCLSGVRGSVTYAAPFSGL